MHNLNIINKAKSLNLTLEKPSPMLQIPINLKRIIATLNLTEKRLKKVLKMPKPKPLFLKHLKVKRIIQPLPLSIKAPLTSRSMSHLIFSSVSRRV